MAATYASFPRNPKLKDTDEQSASETGALYRVNCGRAIRKAWLTGQPQP
jgi:hypothetical protein